MTKLVTRRNFLKISAMGALGATATTVLGGAAFAEEGKAIYNAGHLQRQRAGTGEHGHGNDDL